VRLVELQLRAHVDHERAAVASLVDLPRGQRVRLHDLLDQRAAVDRDDRAEVGRLRAERRGEAGDELVLAGDPEQGLVRTLEPDRRGALEVHPRAAAHRAAEVPGPDLGRLRQRHQLLAQ
jgi:hypothetical protein